MYIEVIRLTLIECKSIKKAITDYIMFYYSHWDCYEVLVFMYLLPTVYHYLTGCQFYASSQLQTHDYLVKR